MNRTTSVSQSILRMPLLWGGLACLAFYAVMGRSTLNHPLVVRYFQSHPVEYVTTALFFMGLAALVIKLISVLAQWRSEEKDVLEPVPEAGQTVEEVPRLLAQVKRLSLPIRNGYLGRRMQTALDFVRRKSSADSLDDHLYFLADSDLLRLQSSYASVRIVIWAIPILGFLGTVIGITLAIAKLNPEALQNSLPEVTAGLSVAFDTTALALALSIVLMFAKFGVERIETRLLDRVDQIVSRELLGRFDRATWSNNPDVAAVRRIADGVLETCNQVVERQANIWRDTIDVAHDRWAELTTSAGELLEAALSDALSVGLKQHADALDGSATARVEELRDAMHSSSSAFQAHVEQITAQVESSLEILGTKLESSVAHLNTSLAEALANHTRCLAESEGEISEANRTHLREVQLSLVDAAAATVEQQDQLVKQGEMLLKVVDATGQIQGLERTLNSNLAALAGAQNFEQTVTSLAAAVQLLSSRLSGPAHGRVSLSEPDHSPQSEAA